MYLFLNRGAGMSTGKAAAQAAHAAVEAYLATPESNLKRVWHRGGHYTKIVLAADDETHLHTIQRYLFDRGFESQLIVDEGMTEVRPHTATALGVEIVDKDHAHAQATFSTFSLYHDPKVKAWRQRWSLHTNGFLRPGKVWVEDKSVRVSP
jgi:peptidyl-tRNA hydrolase